MSRLPIKTRVALEMERHLRKEKAKQHPLEQLFWECTMRCNLHCLHCGSDCHVDAAQPDMPAEDFLRVIDSITPHVNPHKVMIIITGGEPLVRQDLEEVGTELYKREYPWGIVSNGLLLTEERLQRLMQSGMRSISLSLDGFEDAHNWLRGHKESHSRVMRAIEMLSHTEHLEWDIITCVNQRNYPTLSALKECLISAGVRHWRLFTIFPVGRASGNPTLQLEDKDYQGLMDFIAQTREEGRIDASYACQGFLGEYEGKVRDHLFSCQAGISVGSVLIDGSISSCMSIRYNHCQGNIYQDDFMDVWKHRFQVYRDRSWARKGICADCDMFRYCEGDGMHLHEDDGSLLFCHYYKIAHKT